MIVYVITRVCAISFSFLLLTRSDSSSWLLALSDSSSCIDTFSLDVLLVLPALASYSLVGDSSLSRDARNVCIQANTVKGE